MTTLPLELQTKICFLLKKLLNAGTGMRRGYPNP